MQFSTMTFCKFSPCFINFSPVHTSLLLANDNYRVSNCMRCASSFNKINNKIVKAHNEEPP